MLKRIYFTLPILLFSYSILAQDKELSSGFKEYYPIHIKPSIGYLSSMYESEDIVFDAKPTVYYSFWNTMRDRMQDLSESPGNAVYVTFQPHIRMYNQTSLPVKMPSYRVALGWQYLKKTIENDYYSIGFETGHYSNGQSGCAFLEGVEDESTTCLAFHNTITSESNLSQLLNRSNGNFSTNWTKISFNYRINTFRKDGKPRKAHSLLASWERYHNNLIWAFDIGGYTDFDINIYGRNRFSLGYEFIHTYGGKFRYSAGINLEYINKPHQWVEPFRMEITGIVYPWNLDFGLYLTYVNGHDNYNYRFVDSGNQIGAGIIWDWFAPVDRVSGKEIDIKENTIID